MSDAEAAARRALTRLVRESGRDVLAGLVRVTGDLTLAEDAVQDAVVRALETWPRSGIPPNPVAWIRLVARRRATDLVRREIARRPKERTAMDPRLYVPGADDDPGSRCATRGLDDEPSSVDDDLLRLVFTCCHPSLEPRTQVALALRTLCGLSTAEVARALLVPEPTMSKRLTRAKQKIRQARIPYRVPPDHKLPDRWRAVLTTVYLVHNEGYAATTGPDLLRSDLLAEAERLSRLLVRLQPDDPGALGLLALILLHCSRQTTRTDALGDVVLLADQDRSRWNHDLAREGVLLVGEALRRTPQRPHRYAVEAAIAACHSLAPTYEATDWDAIISWYDVLLVLDPGPVVRLNRAAAIGERDGPAAALVLVDDLAPALTSYPLWHAARAVLLRRLGREEDADAADASAAALPMNDPQRRLIRS